MSINVNIVGQGPLQRIFVPYGNYATGTTVFNPYVNAIPDNTKGDEYMTASITPLSATSRLEVEAQFIGCPSNPVTIGVALFQDLSTNAIASSCAGCNPAANVSQMICIKASVASTSTSPTTFKIRAGCASAGTTSFNGGGGARIGGGVMNSYIAITEWAS